jgi:hypothetical protein
MESTSSGETRSSASSARTQGWVAWSMAAFRWPAMVTPRTSITRAPKCRARATVPSVDPASATITSEAHRTERRQSGSRSASFRVGMTTVTGIPE